MRTPDHLHTCCAIDAEVFTYQALIRDTLINEEARAEISDREDLNAAERLLLMLPVANRYREIVTSMKGLELD
jgi:hypothetical protein